MSKYDEDKIGRMKEAGVICSEIFKEVIDRTKEGISLKELDEIAESGCKERNVRPAFKGYEGFPATLCTGVNDIVVHGIPDGYILTSGDIVSVDFGIEYKGVYSDMAITVPIGRVTSEVDQLLLTTKQALFAGIKEARVGNRVGDIGAAMQKIVENKGYSVVREMVGHGIGYDLHEEPNIPGYGTPGSGERLYDGQTIAIEAIVNQGRPEILISSDDDWTTFTEDGMLSTLFEHTVVVGDEPIVLTAW